MEQITTFDKYAIFQRGLKQYQAVEGKTLAIDRIEGEPGQKVEFKEVLFRKDGDNKFEFGQPSARLCDSSDCQTDERPKENCTSF